MNSIQVIKLLDHFNKKCPCSQNIESMMNYEIAISQSLMKCKYEIDISCHTNIYILSYFILLCIPGKYGYNMK